MEKFSKWKSINEKKLCKKKIGTPENARISWRTNEDDLNAIE